MRLSKSIKTIFLGSACICLLFASCDNDDTTPLEAFGDVYVVKTKVGEDVKFAPSFFVYSNKNMKSVTVQPKDEQTTSYTLVASSSTKTFFSLVPSDNDFKETTPIEGDYNFTVTSIDEEDAVLKVIDKLGAESLDIPAIASSEFADEKLKLTWETVANADAYLIQLCDNGSIIFSSKVLASTVKEYTFGVADSGWIDASKKAEDDKTYSVQLKAIRYETGVTIDKGNNVQCISYCEEDAIWGTEAE